MARRLELIEFSMPVSRRGMTASADTRLAYEACTRYIASSINGMEIQATADMEKWIPLADGLEGELYAQACVMMVEAVKSGEGDEASQVEKWLLIQRASVRLMHFCAEIAQHRGCFTISRDDVEAAWDVLGTSANRMPCAGFLAVDDLESESQESGEENEAYDSSEDIGSDDDSDDDDDDYDDEFNDECNDAYSDDYMSDVHNDDDNDYDDWVPEASSREEAGEVERGGHNLTLAPEMVSRLEENLLARGLSLDGSANDLLERLLRAVPPPPTSAPAAAGGAPASPAAKGVKRGSSAVHRNPLADRCNLAEDSSTLRAESDIPLGVEGVGPPPNDGAKRAKR